MYVPGLAAVVKETDCVGELVLMTFGVTSRVRLVIIGIRRSLWGWWRVLFERIHDDLDGFLQLGVVSLAGEFRIFVHFDVWRDALVFAWHAQEHQESKRGRHLVTLICTLLKSC